ncbi:phosphatidylethanolamine-binding protein [Emericellopsis atlantica]|uniref:Phosphatidylethanolamine-binding protein n=1 Tax=Emericellopsis atlantica TaxID=2614577 RepID=A0A9P7ZD41_9HYPO|nr:phosphatidylethanolamine-binding protein [Emericellopsis atlantica]KAG9249546.1 phosphatidylethanolamine-binding protein [Emericellopsis atlantica]
MSQQNDAQALRKSLAEAGLVPGPAASLVPEDFSPSTQLAIKFGDRLIELGTFFRASECKAAPSVSFAPEANSTESSTYMLLLIDPDAPTPDDPKFAFWRHWVVSGLRPDAAPASNEGSPSVLTEFLGPGPKDESAPHRYLFLLFREPQSLSLAKDDVGGEEFVQRRSFDAAKFVSSNGLQLVAVNWMLCAGDGWTA